MPGGEQFGRGASINGDLVVIGGSSEMAVVFRYDGTKWTQAQTLAAADGEAVGQFAHHISISGSDVMISRATDNEGFGAAYIFDLAESVSVEEPLSLGLPALRLIDIYPNPFSESVSVHIVVTETEYIRFEIFDISGRLIYRAAERVFFPGEHILKWVPGTVSGGLYFFRLHTDRQVSTLRAVLIR